ncbi:hypothetical protein [Siccibacter turicensis]|uniref:hypothetical protein n=1 Tax=Siccibacter turicensis TaxID=357233 RepID=UPI002A69A9F9|nr:hypothetical protein [Siccibacter turicensis]MDY0970687.1 hypothetical protein [Siccibacter turicensis]
MAKYALSLLIKIVLFAVVMLIVAKVVPYEGLVDSFTGLFDFQGADKFTRFILGEPDPEVWESLGGYFSILVNTLISIPAMSAIITAYSVVAHNVSPAGFPKEWASSTVRRFVKILGFTFLFWALFRLLPYQSVFPDQTYSNFTMAAIVGFHLLLTIVCYGFITKKITTKRSL